MRLDSEAPTCVRRLKAIAHPRALDAAKVISPAHSIARRSPTVCVPPRTLIDALVQAACSSVDYKASPGSDDGLAAYLAELEVCRANLGGVEGLI